MEKPMQLKITATDVLTEFDGVPVRVWQGVTEEGIACHVFVHRIAVAEGQDQSAFEKALIEKLPPGRVIPLSLIL